MNNKITKILRIVVVKLATCIADRETSEKLGKVVTFQRLNDFAGMYGRADILERLDNIFDKTSNFYQHTTLRLVVLLKGYARFLVRKEANQIELELVKLNTKYTFILNYLPSYTNRPKLSIIDDDLLDVIAKIINRYRHEVEDIDLLIKELSDNKGKVFINTTGNDSLEELIQCIE